MFTGRKNVDLIKSGPAPSVEFHEAFWHWLTVCQYSDAPIIVVKQRLRLHAVSVVVFLVVVCVCVLVCVAPLAPAPCHLYEENKRKTRILSASTSRYFEGETRRGRNRLHP